MKVVLVLFVLVVLSHGLNAEPTREDTFSPSLLHWSIPSTSPSFLVDPRIGKGIGADRGEATGSSGHSAEGAEETSLSPRWSIFAYGGKWTDNRFGEILMGQSEIEESYIWTIGVSRSLTRLDRHLLLEGEMNVARHTHEQDHVEFNGGLNLRLTKLPWEAYLDSSIAFGLGHSYASEEPHIEEISGDRGANRYLFFMQAEFAVALTSTETSSWEGFLRIHHRSGGFGQIIDAQGSNFLTLGVRYRFD